MSKKNDNPKNGVPNEKTKIVNQKTGIKGKDDTNNLENLKNDRYQELNQIIEKLEQVKEDLKEELEYTKEFNKFKQCFLMFKDYFNTNAEEVKNNTEELKNLKEQLSETKELINDSLKQQLEETNENFKKSIDLRQSKGELRREIEKWQNFAVDFFDNLERMSLLSKDDKYKEAVEKVIEDFNRSVNNLGLERIIPSKGDDLKEELHEANEKESADVEPGKVIECKKWGYKINGKLYKDQRAKVFVAKQIAETFKGDTLGNTTEQGTDNQK